jgi:hypothetical protein
MMLVIAPSRLKGLDICFTCFLGDWIIAECLALVFLKAFYSLLQHLEPFVSPISNGKEMDDLGLPPEKIAVGIYHSPGCSSGSKMALLVENLTAILATTERGKT